MIRARARLLSLAFSRTPQNLACATRSPIEFAPCMRGGARALIGDGFDFAVDDCAYPEARSARRGPRARSLSVESNIGALSLPSL